MQAKWKNNRKQHMVWLHDVNSVNFWFSRREANPIALAGDSNPNNLAMDETMKMSRLGHGKFLCNHKCSLQTNGKRKFKNNYILFWITFQAGVSGFGVRSGNSRKLFFERDLSKPKATSIQHPRSLCDSWCRWRWDGELGRVALAKTF